MTKGDHDVIEDDRKSRREPTGPGPRLRPTDPATLIVMALAATAVSWLVVGNYYGDLPTIPWVPAFTVFALAIGEGVLARATRARIERRPGAAPLQPLAIARYAVLAKASSLAAAIFGGFYLGLLVWLLVWRGRLAAAAADLPSTVGGLVAATALVTAGLWLEHACRVPKSQDDDEPEQ